LKSASGTFFLYTFWKSFSFLGHVAKTENDAGKLYKLGKPSFLHIGMTFFWMERFDSCHAKWDTLLHSSFEVPHIKRIFYFTSSKNFLCFFFEFPLYNENWMLEWKLIQEPLLYRIYNDIYLSHKHWMSFQQSKTS
jgi:hypothetical protein